MGEVIYEMAKMVFGDTLANDLGDWIATVFGLLEGTLNTLMSSSLWSVCISVGCSLLVIYFFQSMMDQASRDMFTFEKLIVSFIKMLVAFSVLVYLKDILGYVIQLGGAFNELVKSSFSVSQSFHADAQDAYANYFNHIYKILSILGAIFILLIPYAIAFFAEIMGKFLILSSAIMLMVRCVFSPIAVVQLFEDGSRSSGMRYLKGLFADALSFAVIIVIIYVANTIGNSAISGTAGDTSWWTVPEQMLSNFTFSKSILYIIPKLAIAGGMASGSKIAHDIVGA